MASVSLALSLYSYVAPLRVGFVFITNYDTSVTGLSDPSVAVNNAFHYFLENQGAKEAEQFLVKKKKKSFISIVLTINNFNLAFSKELRINTNEFVPVRTLHRLECHNRGRR